MANEDMISPRKTMFVLVVVVGCFALLWPRLLYPMFMGNIRDQIRPNKFDKEAGCCNMIFETDVTAIRIMIELCSNLLGGHGEVDDRTKLVFQTGKLSREVINKCRIEVNSTCGIDISVFLDTNIRLGKSYKQLLDEIRSYNGSNCLRMNFGVPLWALGVPHILASTRNRPESLDNHVRQERSPFMHPTAGPHPAMMERGRTIASSKPSPPSQGPVPLGRRPQEGPRVGQARREYTLTDIYQRQDEPIVPGMRPPMGGAGHVVPPPKTATMGLLMPLYTAIIVIFFVYTLTKLLFRNQRPEQVGPYEYVESNPEFRRRVFHDGEKPPSSRFTAEPSKLVVSAISGLVAEVRQQMDETKTQADTQQAAFTDIQTPHTNGSVYVPKTSEDLYSAKDSVFNSIQDRTPIKEIILEEESPTPQIDLRQDHFHFERNSTPARESKEPTPEITISEPEQREATPEAIEPTLNYSESYNRVKQSTPELAEPSPEVMDWSRDILDDSKEVSPEPEELVEEYEIENVTGLMEKADALFREPAPSPNDRAFEPEEEIYEERDPIDEAEEISREIKEAILDELSYEQDKAIYHFSEVQEPTPEPEEPTPEPEEPSQGVKQSSPFPAGQDQVDLDDYEEVEVEDEEVEAERAESPAIMQLRSNIENERATVKVLGMEMTASHKDGTAWGDRPRSPPGPTETPSQVLGAHGPMNPPRKRTPSPPISAIFLEGALPHQSRLLVTESETHTETNGDSPIVLSGKMTLSVINDESATPDRESEDTVNGGDDEDFTTASATTYPKQILQEDEQLSEEEVEEEVEEEDEEEIEEEEIEELEEDEIQTKKTN